MSQELLMLPLISSKKKGKSSLEEKPVKDSSYEAAEDNYKIDYGQSAGNNEDDDSKLTL